MDGLPSFFAEDFLSTYNGTMPVFSFYRSLVGRTS